MPSSQLDGVEGCGASVFKAGFIMSSIAMDGFCWKDELLLGNTRMDEEHRTFALLIRSLLDAPDDALAVALDELVVHATQHFEEEDAWMRKLSFPAQACHMQEHAAVLMSAAGVRRRLCDGEFRVVRQFAAELAAWFPPHLQHLDSALAHWICKHAWGGKPLVFRRNAPSTEAFVNAHVLL